MELLEAAMEGNGECNITSWYQFSSSDATCGSLSSPHAHIETAEEHLTGDSQAKHKFADDVAAGF